MCLKEYKYILLGVQLIAELQFFIFSIYHRDKCMVFFQQGLLIVMQLMVLLMPLVLAYEIIRKEDNYIKLLMPVIVMTIINFISYILLPFGI